MIDIVGHPRGNGNPHDMATAPATRDAAVVTALRAAGADIFAATSLLEYAAGAVHPGVPEARNPFDPGRTAGGSSGGSAALVGAGVCPAALGTDTGGSIRIPAHYCGVVGFKPSFGAIDVTGTQPLSPSLDHVGILGADVAITASVFAGITGQAPANPPATLRLGLVRPNTVEKVLKKWSMNLLRLTACTIPIGTAMTTARMTEIPTRMTDLRIRWPSNDATLWLRFHE
jgi:Asp-tRNA(Asn)/Glu-tRNA(Gln) amidotransferase A subunit family amidase